MEKNKPLYVILGIFVIALILEVSLFNIRHWSTRSAPPVINAFNLELSQSEDLVFRFKEYEPEQPLQVQEKMDFFTDYFNTIVQDDVIVIISTRETTGDCFSHVSAAFNQAGLMGINPHLSYVTYAAVIDSGQLIFEDARAGNTSEIRQDLDIDGLSVSLISAGVFVADLSSIMINGAEYSLNHRGLNIVIYDKTTGEVTDSVNFDTHANLHIQRMKLFSDSEPVFQPLAPKAQLTISNIGEEIRTLYIQPHFGNSYARFTDVEIHYKDENSEHTLSVTILNAPDNYISLGAMGKVDSLTITFEAENAGLQGLYFNRPLPWSFKLPRVLLLTFFVSFIYLWKKFRFSDAIFNPQSTWQKITDAVVVFSFILLLIFSTVAATDFGYIPGSNNETQWKPTQNVNQGIYNYMLEALLLGQLYLNIEPHESLLNAEQPYNFTYREQNEVIAPWDHVYYEGKFYSYFGMVPVFVLFLPYFLIEGSFLSTVAATLIFSAICSVGIYLLWKELAKKYLQNIPYTLYIAGLITALFGTNVMMIITRAYKYEVAIASGLMFSVWGLFFILRATRNGACYEKINAVFLFLGGTCMALAVGCRPTMLLSSLVVPVILLPTLQSCLPSNENKALTTVVKKIFALAIPYIIIGGALAWFNYARFGSITEFGTSYQLTKENVSLVTQTGLLGNLRRVYDGIAGYLFTGFRIMPQFPFIHATIPSHLFSGYTPQYEITGLFYLPIIWFFPVIFCVRKKDDVKKVLPLILSMFLTALLMLLFSSVMIGVINRYTVDFAWLFVFPSLVCMCLLYKEALNIGDTTAIIVRRLCFAAVAVSCIFLFSNGFKEELSLVWEHNPFIIKYLTDMFLIL